MRFRYKLIYKNGLEIIVNADNMLDLLNGIAKCISDEAYVKFTDVFTFFDGYTHKTIKQNKYIHVLPAFIALLKSEYTIKKLETLSDEKDSIRIENFCNMFDRTKSNEILPEVIKDIYKDGGSIVRLNDDGTETQIPLDLIEEYQYLYDFYISIDDNDNTYFTMIKKGETSLKKNEINIYAVTRGFDCDRRSLYFSRVRDIMQHHIDENHIYRFNGLIFTIEADKYAKDKYKFRCIEKDRYMTITFMEETIEAFNYAGDIKLNGNMVFERVEKSENGEYKAIAW